MSIRVLAFDLDDTLAITKSPISAAMADLLGRALLVYELCVISGGSFQQIRDQVIRQLDVPPEQLARLHIMPTSGTRYYRFEIGQHEWVKQYAEDLTDAEKENIIEVLTTSAKQLGYWEASPYGDIVEDRGSQITFSALGQKAPPEVKYPWDPDRAKRENWRRLAAEQLPDLAVGIGGTTSLDVTRKGVDKAYGMTKLMNILNLGADQIVFFGDQLQEGGNDHPVIQTGVTTITVRDSIDTTVALAAIVAVSVPESIASQH